MTDDQQVNPFHTQGYIRDEALFYGRQTELTVIWGYLRKNFNVSIVAPRLVGKSSLLWFIKNKAAANLAPLPGPAPLPKIETFYLDMQVIPTAEAFWLRLAEALGKDKENADPRSLEKELEKRRVILCLDEFDNTAFNDAFPDDFFTLLRGLSQGGNLSLVIATKIPLIRYAKEGMTSPFYNIFPPSPLTLGPFTRDDAVALLTGIAGRAGKTFKPADVEKALDIVAAGEGKYYPWNVQMMGWCWFESGFDLEKAAIKYRDALADKKEPGPGPNPEEDEEVLEKRAADTRTVTPPQKPPVMQEKASDWIPKAAAFLTFIFVMVTFYTIVARDIGMIWIDIGVAGVIGGLYAWHIFRTGGKKS